MYGGLAVRVVSMNHHQTEGFDEALQLSSHDEAMAERAREHDSEGEAESSFAAFDCSRFAGIAVCLKSARKADLPELGAETARCTSADTLEVARGRWYCK